MLTRQFSFLLLSAGFLPLSISSGCTHTARPVHTDLVYKTREAGFSQAVKAKGFLFTSGTVGWKADRSMDNASFETQLNQAFSNIEHLAREGRSSLDQAILLRFYVVQLDAHKRRLISEKMLELFPGDYKPATTLLGVSALAHEKLLLEIELIAGINTPRPR